MTRRCTCCGNALLAGLGLALGLASTTHGQCVGGCGNGDVSEGETCLVQDDIDVTNGGCNLATPLFSSIGPNDVVCGIMSTYLVDISDPPDGVREDVRDTDWYVITAGQLQAIDAAGTGSGYVSVTATLQSEFDGLVFVADASDCVAGAVILSAQDTVAGCVGQSASHTVSTASDIHIIVTTDGLHGIDPNTSLPYVQCGVNDEYTLTVTTVGDVPAPCGTSTNACGVAGQGSGCRVPDCCYQVCVSGVNPLPFCCVVMWSQVCADVALNIGCATPAPCIDPQGDGGNCQAPDTQAHGNAATTLATPSDADLLDEQMQPVPIRLADNFVPARSGAINELCWWGEDLTTDGAFTACSPSGNDEFTVTYYLDNGGRPGAVLAGPFTVGATVASTGTFDANSNLILQYHATHADVGVTAGACYWVEVQNDDGDGDCAFFWLTAVDRDAYSLADGDGTWEDEDGADYDLGFCTNLELDLTGDTCGPPDYADESCPAGDFSITQNDDPTGLIINSVVCKDTLNGDFVTRDNWFARSYDLSQGATAGLDVNVDCVQFGIEINRGHPFNMRVNLYVDTDGGAPTAPGTDLVLLATSADILVPVGERLRLRIADFTAAPVNVGVDQVLVVELEQDDRDCTGGAPGDCGGIWPGSNDSGETADGYIRSEICGFSDYVTFTAINAPQVHLVQTVVLSEAGGGGCIEDCALPADSCVDAVDFFQLIGEWGLVGTPCDFGVGAPGVDTVDFFQLIGAWGLCNSGGAPCP